MCGRYSITTPPEAMARLFGLVGPTPNFPARYNVAPTQEIPVIRYISGTPEFAQMRWGLVPSWSKQGSASKPLINARCESVDEKPSFRTAFKRRRCLMPADGFYEWHRPEDAPKTPYNICRTDGGVFAMAGIWDVWTAPDGSELESCALITTHANDLMEPIHHRMPVILEPGDWEAWLSTDEADAASLKPLLVPAQSELFKAYSVSTKVNRVANQGPELILPAPAQTASPTPSPTDQGSLF